jgi:hypothetical protein
MEITMSPVVTSRLSPPAIAMIVSLAAGSGAAMAQEQALPESQGAPARQAAMCQMDEHIDGDLAYLKAEIKVTDAQITQWNIFAQAFRAEREKRARLCREAMQQAREMKSASLPDALKMAEDQLALRLDSLRAMKVAVQPLYDSLTKEQKKSADQIMRGGQIF